MPSAKTTSTKKTQKSTKGVKKTTVSKPLLNRATLKKNYSLLELLESVKALEAKELIIKSPYTTGFNKMGKTELINTIDSYLFPKLEQLILENRAQRANRKLTPEQQGLYDTLFKYPFKVIVETIRTTKTQITNMHTLKKADLVYSLVETNNAPKVIAALPALVEKPAAVKTAAIKLAAPVQVQQ